MCIHGFKITDLCSEFQNHEQDGLDSGSLTQACDYIHTHLRK
jgi:hypothetical protein